MSDDTIEVAVLRSARDALKSGGEVPLFSAHARRLFAMQEQVLESDTLPQELTTAVGQLATISNITHLVLVTKHSADVSMPLHNGHVGNGRLTGLGFYLDRNMRLHDIDTGETSTGFIAPFASLEVMLIDVRTMQAVRHVRANRAKVLEAAASKNAVAPWDILTPSEKVGSLVDVLDAALRDAVPKVLAGE